MLALQDPMDRDTVANDRYARHMAIRMAAKDRTRHSQEIIRRDQAGIPQEPLISDIDRYAWRHL
jgi:hypothetical protein